MTVFSLAADLRPRDHAPAFAAEGRLHLPGVLSPDTAEAVADALEAETEWTTTVRAGGEVFEAPLGEDGLALSDTHRTWLAGVRPDGRDAMQYVFDTRRVSDARGRGHGRGDVLDRLPAWLNEGPFLDLIRELTGDDRPEFCDAQATRYRPGHFLTRHDDTNAARDRLYAYVLNFTRTWRADWGGLLTFPDERGHVARAYTPAFNALNLFRVPTTHAVGQVASFAPADRLSITGWVRFRRPEAV